MFNYNILKNEAFEVYREDKQALEICHFTLPTLKPHLVRQFSCT